ncbi:MAG: PAS domain S-box protein [Nitrospirae bacterium]|nr:PAS domain S-box protein [Nitrospirota bacterium]
MNEHRDITGLKNTDEALRKFADIFQFTRIGIAVGNPGNMLLETVNPAYAEMHGYTVEELIGRPIADVYPPEARAELSKNAQVINETGHLSYETMHIGKDGNVFPVQVDAFGIRDEQGNVRYQIVTVQDITERKQAENTLRESESRFRTAVESLPFDLWIMGPDGRYVLQNTTSKKMWGDVTGKRLEDLNVNADNIEIWQKNNSRAFAGETIHGEVRMIVRGEERFFSNIIAPIADGDAIRSILGINIDITERKKSEEALREVNERLNAILEASPAAIFLMDRDGIISMWNKAAEQMFGWSQEEAVGRVLPIVPEHKHDEFLALSKRLLEGESLIAIELRRQKKDGSPIDISVYAAPVYDAAGEVHSLMSVVTDITLRKKMEEDLIQKEKLESIGILAGGIAHDFNNLLTSVVGNISMAKMLSNPHSEEFRRLVEAEKASLRAKDLTQQLLTFSKGGEPIKKVTSLEGLLKDSAGFVLRGSKSKAEVSAPDDLWHVDADEGQISQVIHNIILNADQAMPQGGIIKVRCENTVIENEESNILKNGRYVNIAIQDQGIGIPKGQVEKIFDPYFTTKQRGSGLGLATSYSIIKKHEGLIRVESELGVGTTFHVYLPASDKELAPAVRPDENALKGKGKILVMDDEEMVSTVAGDMLKTLGYKTEFSADGADAIERYKKAREDHEPFDIVIMDLTIQGGMGGAETIKKLREIDPDVKAIVSSGYSNDPIMANFSEFGFKGVITKPYRLSDISGVVSSVLTRS